MKNGRIEKRFLIGLIGVVLLLTIFLFSGHTEIPQKINYQGYLTNAAGVPVNGTVQMIFSIYDVPTNGIQLSTETQNVSVSHGVYDVNLGDVNPINLLFDKPYYLGVKVGTDPEMTPRKSLTTVPYAFRAEYGLQGPAGPQGPKGDKGPQGPQGPPGVGIKPIKSLSGEAVVEIASDGAPVCGTVVSPTPINIVNLTGTTHTYSTSGNAGDIDGAGAFSIDGNYDTYFGFGLTEASGKPITVTATAISQHIFPTTYHITELDYRLYGHSRHSFDGTDGITVRIEYTLNGSDWLTVPNTEWHYDWNQIKGSHSYDTGHVTLAVSLNDCRGIRAYAYAVGNDGDGHVDAYVEIYEIQAFAIPYSYTVTTNPSGLQISVDGSSYTAPQTFSWTPGSTHTLSVSSPQSGTSGIRYIYFSWSDGGTQTHQITAPFSNPTYTATFTTQYLLSATVNPSGSGVITISPSGPWYNSGQTVQLTANANSGYSFSGWSGDLSGKTNPASITMNAPKSVTANFSQSCGYILTVNINPPGCGTVTKNPDKSAYCPGDIVTLTAIPNPCCSFSSWSGDLTGSTNPASITMNGNKTVTAMFIMRNGWFDDFESYTAGQFPSPNWTYSGNSDIHVDNTQHVSGSQSVRLYGILGSCWAAVLHRDSNACPPLTIEFYVRNGSENLSGCHQKRAGMALYTGQSWATPGRQLITFDGDGKIRGSAKLDNSFVGTILGTYLSNEWIKVKIVYEVLDASTVRVSYWINNEFKTSESLPSFSFENNLSYVTVGVGEGTAWFDDIKVTPGTIPEGNTATRDLPNCYTPSAPSTVTILVTPSGTTNTYAVEDIPPIGWIVSSINESGRWDSVNKKVKWGPFFDHSNRTLTYNVTPPSGDTGTKCFSGAASFDGASVPIGGGDTWKGEYFNNKTLSGSPVMVRDDGVGFIDFNWGASSPSSTCGIGSDNFSVRWTRTVSFDAATYRFTVTSDDGFRLYIDGTLKLDKWFDQSAPTYTVDVPLTAGGHTLMMEYYENGGVAVAKLSWEKVSTDSDCIATVSSDSCIEKCVCTPHPADTNSNYLMAINEVTAYSSAWITGQTWPTPPNPIPIEYVTNAGYLWRMGEVYHCDLTKTPPWVPGPAPAGEVQKDSIVSEQGPVFLGMGSAIRDLPDTYTPSVPVSVSISVSPNSATLVYAVEDTPPVGWVVSNINENGQWDSVNKEVKWGPFFDSNIRTLTYQATPPSGETGAKTFSGTVSFDGNNVSIGGN